ncbi:MAG: 1-deoxy-D-xylulose-5-phosphate synthase [candidate division KSB1 bacterium]|nr:1-deoxy-D-xylulose-5-phosphate synthase [candidate division KSB1 bacterium]
MEQRQATYPLLDRINSPADLRNLDIPELCQLAKELREFIVSTVSCTGGHLAPSLGVVELTLALHYVFDTPRDKIIWDVGHQSYPHKILTGRREQFATLRQWGGISGFPRREESPYDVFGTGHASTSISAALGIACARDLAKEDYAVVAVIGDGSMSGGLAFEGLNNAGALKRDLLVILNDNRMSISRNVGALAEYLTQLITAPAYNVLKRDIWELTGKLSHLGGHIRTAVRRLEEGLKALVVPGLLFERLGFRYFGPIDGHNLALLVRVLHEVRRLKGPIFLHVLTTKGKGYEPAEKDAPRFHGLGPFKIHTGETAAPHKNRTYTEVFGETMVEIAAKRPKVVGITAAMELGTGLWRLHEAFPDRFFDVGIAEAHAVTFAGGLATQGLKPVVAIYSTFLQRAYDQIIHDIALQKLPVVFALDRGGLVGDDGPTHHGSFDLSYLRSVPNLVVAAPKDENELRHLLWTAVDYDGPIALRYPRGEGVGVPMDSDPALVPIGTSECLRSGQDIAFLALGPLVYRCLEVAERLAKQDIDCTVINARFLKPLDELMLRQVAERHQLLVTAEDNTVVGGFGSAVGEWLADHGFGHVRLLRLGLPDQFVPHGTLKELHAHVGLDVEGIGKATLRAWKETMHLVHSPAARAVS